MNWISDEDCRKTIRIVDLLREGYMHKQIAFTVGCSLQHVVNVKYRYLKRQIVYALSPAGQALVNGVDQPKLPLVPRRETQQTKFLRSLRKR